MRAIFQIFFSQTNFISFRHFIVVYHYHRHNQQQQKDEIRFLYIIYIDDVINENIRDAFV